MRSSEMTLPSEMTVKEIAEIVVRELDACKEQFTTDTHPLLRCEPFFAFVRANVTKRGFGDSKILGGKKSANYLVTRNKPSTNTTSNEISFIYDRTWMNGIYAEDYGNVVKRTPANTGWYYEIEVLETCVFEIDPEEWDAIRSRFHFRIENEFVASLRDLLTKSVVPLAEPWELMSRTFGLKSRPGLDKVQNEISILPLNNRIVLSGPPGSGKTTTMIRRLALKSNADHAKEIGESTDSLNSWIAFTPTDTLRTYLKEAMTRDGLLAPSDRVRIWDDERGIIARDYLKFIGPTAFRVSNNSVLESWSGDEIWGYYEKFIAYLDDRFDERALARDLQKIPETYKLFRDEYMQLENNAPDANTSSYAMQTGQLSYKEIDLLIFTILNIANRYLRSNTDRLFRNTGVDLLENIKTLHKRLVVIDEAADFTRFQLGAMYNLSDPRFRSVMFVGDPMQRLRGDGIDSWNELRYFVDDFRTVEFSNDYRQSPKLARMTAILSNREVSGLSISSEQSPFPLLFKGQIDSDLASWLVERILEIYRKNKQMLPTVALVVPCEAHIGGLFEILSPILDQYAFALEKCQHGQSSGEDSRIRIFSVDYIKGLEFDAVFFLSVDKVEKPDLLDKYLYVGLTRSRAFLAVTYEDSLPRILSKVESCFSTADWSDL